MAFWIAIAPIIWLLAALNWLKMKSHIAALIALGIALVAAVGQYGMSGIHARQAVLEGMALACWPILLVIAAAIFTYNLTLHTGAMSVIRQILSGVSRDRRIMMLLLGWGFGAFLESMAGFGTPVAIPAGMLIGMGFPPFKAATVCLLANTVPTAYGAIGILEATMSRITGIDAAILGQYVSLQILPFNLITPFLMIIAAEGSIKALKGMKTIALLAGAGLAVPQILISFLLGPELAGLASSVITMGIIAAGAKYLLPGDSAYNMDIKEETKTVSFQNGLRASLPFLLILLLLLGTSKLFPFIYEPLNQIKTAVPIYQGEGGAPYIFTWIATPGVLILAAALISGRLQKALWKDMGAILGKTGWDLRYTAITIIAVIAAAKVMGYSGMTGTMAETAVAATGAFYPAAAPFVASLGTFITGSATSSCVLFGELQTNAAAAIGSSPAWLAASNISGACLGKMISPQSIAIAAGAAALTGREADLMKWTVKYYLPFVLLMGAIIYFGQLGLSSF